MTHFENEVCSSFTVDRSVPVNVQTPICDRSKIVAEKVPPEKSQPLTIPSRMRQPSKWARVNWL